MASAETDEELRLLDLSHELLVNVLSRIDARSACAAAKACPALLRAATDRRISQEQNLHGAFSARFRSAIAAFAAESLCIPAQIFSHRVMIDLESSFPIELKVDRLSELITASKQQQQQQQQQSSQKDSGRDGDAKIENWMRSLISNPAEELLAREAAAARSESGSDHPSRLFVACLQPHKPHMVQCARADWGGVRLRLDPLWQATVVSKNPFSAQSLPTRSVDTRVSHDGDAIPPTLESVRNAAMECAINSLRMLWLDQENGCLVDALQHRPSPSCYLPIGKAGSNVSMEALVTAAHVSAIGRGISRETLLRSPERTVLELASLAVPRRMELWYGDKERITREMASAARILALFVRVVMSDETSGWASDKCEFTHAEAEIALRCDLMREHVAAAQREMDPQPLVTALFRLAAAAEKIRCLRRSQATELAKAVVGCFRLIGLGGVAT
jgi:hypothetical protein